MKNAYFIPNIQYKAMKKIDPLRVSQSISKNMMKDLKKDDYGGTDNAPADIKLANRDQEIMIGEDNNQDDGPQVADNKGKTEQLDKDPEMEKIEQQTEQAPANILGAKKSQAKKRDNPD